MTDRVELTQDIVDTLQDGQMHGGDFYELWGPHNADSTTFVVRAYDRNDDTTGIYRITVEAL